MPVSQLVEFGQFPGRDACTEGDVAEGVARLHFVGHGRRRRSRAITRTTGWNDQRLADPDMVGVGKPVGLDQGRNRNTGPDGDMRQGLVLPHRVGLLGRCRLRADHRDETDDTSDHESGGCAPEPAVGCEVEASIADGL